MGRGWMWFVVCAACSGGGTSEGSDTPVPATEACEAYIDCVAAADPAGLDDVIAAYGEDGSCYGESVDCSAACDDGARDLFALTAEPACDLEDTTVSGTPEEAALAVVDAHCLGCHSAASALGNLDLETDFVGGTVGVVGAYDELIVAPGDPEASTLYLKVTADPDVPGTDMPPGSGGVPADDAAILRTWIEGL